MKGGNDRTERNQKKPQTSIFKDNSIKRYELPIEICNFIDQTTKYLN